MLRFLSALTACMVATLAPFTAHAAPRMSHVMFHSPLHTMGFNHVMATATLTSTNHDTSITFHASHLPAPRVLHKTVYVLWAFDGDMKDKIGPITQKNGNANFMGTVMMVRITELVVTAKDSAMGMGHGTTVLSGMVGR